MSLLSLKLLVVLSASMGRALPVGSLAVVRPQPEYFVGDIVTFKISGSDELLTHRIVEICEDSVYYCDGEAEQLQGAPSESEGRCYKTRGDANNVADDWELTHEDILGKVLFHLPYLGYLLRLPQIVLAAVLQTLSV